MFTIKNTWEKWAEARGVKLRFTIIGKYAATLFREAVPKVFAACLIDAEFPPSASPLSLLRHWGRNKPLAIINYSKSDRLKVAAWLARVPVRTGIGDGGNTWCYHYSHPFISFGQVGHRVFRFLPMTRWAAGADAFPQMDVLEPGRFGGAEVMAKLRDQGWDGGPYVVFGMYPLAPFPERRWFPLDAPWLRLVGLARAAGVTPVLAGGPEHREALEGFARSSGALSMAGQTDLPQLLALLANAMGTIAVDTGIAHLAAATAKPLVVLFGPGSECNDFPCGPKVVSLRGNPAGTPAYPITEAAMAGAKTPWSRATSHIPAERAWGILTYLAGE
jgi:ADP-heptose:LPS heptosyltransferase